MSLAEEFNKPIIDDSIDLDKMESAVAEFEPKIINVACIKNAWLILFSDNSISIQINRILNSLDVDENLFFEISKNMEIILKKCRYYLVN